MFDLSDKNEIDKQTEYVEEQLDNITPMILNKQSTPTGTSIFYRISSIFSKRMYENSRKTKHLHVQDNCT